LTHHGDVKMLCRQPSATTRRQEAKQTSHEQWAY